MYFHIKQDKENLSKYFPLKCKCEKTTGIGNGVILKFNSFYLKIYESNGGYIVQGYRYNSSNVRFRYDIPSKEFSSWASQFNNEGVFEYYCMKNKNENDVVFPCPDKSGYTQAFSTLNECFYCKKKNTCDIYSTMLDEVNDIKKSGDL